MSHAGYMGVYSIRATYLAWRLKHVEADVLVMRSNLKAFEKDAERLRVELALLGRLQ